MIGTQVGRYKITQEIGDGGHAFVFKGVCGDDVVAIKMLKPSVADEDNLEKRFLLEAEALKKLKHPHIVEFKDYVFQGGYHYLVLEYMDQGSVENLMDTMGAIPHRYAIPIFCKVIDAIRFSHDHGYIHRDLKPNNILINSDGAAKLTDFGITKVVGGANITKRGFVLGTTLYMAPEYISQGVVSVKTDIYALGVTFYEMLTTRKPFEHESDDEPLVNFARRVVKGTPTPPSAYKQLPPELERIVMKSIAQNPKERYRSAKEFLKELSKHFPELVKRDIVIPSGRAMTRYLKLDDLGDLATEDNETKSATESGGQGLGTRLSIAAVVAAAIMAVAFFLPQFVGGALAEQSSAVLLGGGGAAAFFFGLLTFMLLPKKTAEGPWASGAQVQAPSLNEPVANTAESAWREDSGFNPEESSIPEFQLEDTIPFHEGHQGQQPFKMTDESELKAYLVVISGPDKGRKFGLRPVSRIGRDLRVDIRPHDPEISRHHCAVTFDGSGFTAEDLGSTNGSFLNEERLVGKRRLKPGDILRAGSSSMRFEH